MWMDGTPGESGNSSVVILSAAQKPKALAADWLLQPALAGARNTIWRSYEFCSSAPATRGFDYGRGILN